MQAGTARDALIAKVWHSGYPHRRVIGDRVYGGRLTVPKGGSEELREALRQFPRQALHAVRLKFNHPVTGRPLDFESALPADLRALLDVLTRDLARE